MVVAGTLAAGCGLIDLASFRSVNFKLPEKKFSVSTSDPRWKSLPGGFPALTCGPGGAVADCCKAPQGAPAVDCTRTPITCESDGQSSVCSLKFLFEVPARVDLGKEVPQLRAAQGRVVSEIFLKKIEYTVTSSLSVDLPEIQLFVAPDGVMSKDDPQARRLGTIPARPAMFEGTEEVDIDQEGQQNFSAFARDFLTPFTIIASTTIIVRGGSAAPQGRVDFSISGKVEARF